MNNNTSPSRNNFMTNEEMEIDLLEIWYLFLEKLKFILLFALLGGLLAGGYSYTQIAPEFESTAKLYIVSASNDSIVNLTDLQIGSNLTSDYKELILSRPMLESVIQNLNLDLSTDALKRKITVSNPAQTRILAIKVITTDPVLSADIANEMAVLTQTWLPEVMECNMPHIAEEAIIPTQKCAPSNAKNAMLGAMAASVLYFGICVIMFLADDTIRSAEDFEKYFGLVPLAVIPEDESIDYGDSDSSTFSRKTLRIFHRRLKGRKQHS